MDPEAETRKHIDLVGKFLNLFAIELLKRAATHDASKLREPEKSLFEKYAPQLNALTYGSPEYKENLKNLDAAVSHHYAHNKHHPEFNDINGFSFSSLNDPIQSMDLVDIVEMICDWMAATRRHKDGNIGRSIAINEERFKINGQLSQVFRNTSAFLEQKLAMLPGED